MEENIIRQGFMAKGTTCENCAKIIKKQALKVEGVKKVEFDYATEEGSVTFDKNKTDIDEVLYKIEEKGYEGFILDETTPKKSSNNTLGWIFGVIGLLIIGYFILKLVDKIALPTISHEMGYGLLFIVGLLTGFHCISMCGGFVVSYTAKNAQQGKSSKVSHLMYGLGKTISYTIIGAAFGLLGSIIAFTPMMRGVVGLLAGTFLILFGLKMLNIIPILRKVQLKTPGFISRFVGKGSKNSSPLIIGLLTGLMIACGPLQAIYIMAAGTGSMIEGAKLLLVFGLGTLPAMLGFGYFASFISSKATHKILKASGAIVIILGIIMVNNGLALTGTGFDVNSVVTSVNAKNIVSDSPSDIPSENLAVMKDDYQEIRMEVDRYGWSPDKFILKKDVPVRWIIDGKEITGCNNAIQVPKYGLDFDIKQGEQVIEFTPTQEGVVSWSCWMGMIPGTFIVKDDVDVFSSEDLQEELDSVHLPSEGGCSGSCGGGCSGGCGGGCGGGR